MRYLGAIETRINNAKCERVEKLKSTGRKTHDNWMSKSNYQYIK